MDGKLKENNGKKRVFQLSLKKNRKNVDEKQKNMDRCSDIIVVDESFDRLRSEYTKSKNNNQTSTLSYSPILINDSSDSFSELAESENEPSKMGNVSFNGSKSSPQKSTKPPSIGGWSPAQNIVCATPRHNQPSTPNEIANESLDNCSLKTVQKSQKKLLNDLYGEVWKSIPSLFKSVHHGEFNGVSKKLYFEDEDDEKENIRQDLKQNKELYLTGSETKTRLENNSDTEKKSKKKLFTEKIMNTPEVPRIKRNINSTTKKNTKKGLSVTELVMSMNKELDVIEKRINDISVTPTVHRLSFMASLADNVPSWRCHPEALQYKDNYKALKEQLTRRLFEEFNREVFDNGLDADMPVCWDTRLRSTAGTTTNRLIKTSSGARIRACSVKLSHKVLDSPLRLRDTLVHELAHAAAWTIDGHIRAGHGALWQKWARRALQVYPELGEISRCHDMQIHYKYTYKCAQCGYSIQRHSKSIDITKKCCGHCRGTFQLILNKKTKEGLVVSTPARSGGTGGFAAFVRENYATHKPGRDHAAVMKILSEEFARSKAS